MAIGTVATKVISLEPAAGARGRGKSRTAATPAGTGGAIPAQHSTAATQPDTAIPTRDTAGPALHDSTALPDSTALSGATTLSDPAPAESGTAGPTRPAGDALRCRCGHDAAAHEHFRAGDDCGACGADTCGRFRTQAADEGALRRWARRRVAALRGRSHTPAGARTQVLR